MSARRVLTPTERHVLMGALEWQAARYLDIAGNGQVDADFWKAKASIAQRLHDELDAGPTIVQVVFEP